MNYVSIEGLVAVTVESRMMTCGWLATYIRCETTWMDLEDLSEPEGHDDCDGTEWVSSEHWEAIATCLASLSGRTLGELEAARSKAQSLCEVLDDRSWDTGREEWSAALGRFAEWLDSHAAPVSADQALASWRNITQPYLAREAPKAAKRSATSTRRQEYQAARPQLVLRMIERGDAYACTECGSVEDLSIDHIIPVSRGGGDDLENLRFLCVPCNSRKRDRIAA
jgi:hypothetical protein